MNVSSSQAVASIEKKPFTASSQHYHTQHSTPKSKSPTNRGYTTKRLFDSVKNSVLKQLSGSKSLLVIQLISLSLNLIGLAKSIAHDPD